MPCSIELSSLWAPSSGLAVERSKCGPPPAPECGKPLTSTYGCELWVGWLEYALGWWWWWLVPADWISGTDDILRALWRESVATSPWMARKKLKLVGLLPADTSSPPAELEEFENVRGLWFPFVLALAPIFLLSLSFFPLFFNNNCEFFFFFLIFTFLIKSQNYDKFVDATPSKADFWLSADVCIALVVILSLFGHLQALLFVFFKISYFYIFFFNSEIQSFFFLLTLAKNYFTSSKHRSKRWISMQRIYSLSLWSNINPIWIILFTNNYGTVQKIVRFVSV